MTRIAINRCYGGFGLSDVAEAALRERWPECPELVPPYDDAIRTNEHVLSIIDEWGDRANAHCSDLRIVDIPDDVEWEIDEYDGMEWVSEKHRRWS